MTDWPIILAALYLRRDNEALRLPARRGSAVIRALRQRAATLDRAVRILREADLWPESVVLETPGLLSWAESKVSKGVVLTVIEDGYPEHWRAELGEAAPLAIWRINKVPSGESLTIVGSRQAPSSALEFCFEVARAAALSGSVVWSGGAEGCDYAAETGAGQRLVSLVPYGLRRSPKSSQCCLSLCAPGEAFTAGAAMERNKLLYAASPLTLVGHVQLRSGATWHAAVDALRRRRRVAVFDDGSSAVDALASLGAFRISSVEDLESVRALPAAQPKLVRVG